MTDIDLDASGWATPLDFYNALLGKLRAPQWHGRNINALVDSIIHGGINEVSAPYRIRVQHLDHAGREAREEAMAAVEALADEGGRLSTASNMILLEIG